MKTLLLGGLAALALVAGMSANELPGPIGHRRWAIAEGYIPSASTGPEPAMTSHETACILNVGDREAHVTIWVYFTDRDPVGPYRLAVPPRRTSHVRFNDLTDPAPVPRDTDYASVIESDVPWSSSGTQAPSTVSIGSLRLTRTDPGE